MTNGETQVMLGHGSGGSMMKRIIDEVFFAEYGTDELAQGDDAAVVPILQANEPSKTSETTPSPGHEDLRNNPVPKWRSPCSRGLVPPKQPRPAGTETSETTPSPNGGRVAFSTDSFVVTPHFFPGGDIGRLAICGTVNDVATSGATPAYISVSMILEEGFPMDDLRRICQSIAETAREANVRIVTGDTKVVNRGSGDGIFINTSGVGFLAPNINLSGRNCRPGDKILVSGTLGDHGMTIMSCREGLNFQADIQTDAAPLNHMIAEVLAAAPSVRCFRDPTRGGLASTLNELADQSQTDFEIAEDAVPVNPQVLGACEMLGYDIMQVANEGKMVCVVGAEDAEAALAAMRANKYGTEAAIIGEVLPYESTDRAPKVYLRTGFGGRRILDMLVGEQLPRIC